MKKNVVDHVLSVGDFTPSIFSYCGIRNEQNYDGRDLFALWKGGSRVVKYPVGSYQWRINFIMDKN